MFQGLRESQLAGAVEALLFVTDEPVGTIALADMLEVEPGAVERALVDLQTRFETDERGVQLREVAGGWRLYTHPIYHGLVEKYVLSWDTRKLSQAAMETLAVLAYSQPVTRAGVASVRGVNSDSSINSLVEKGLVREAGTADTPGSPTLYATTRAFLERFGLRSASDLPDLDQFAPDEETCTFIRERLSATREVGFIAEESLTSGQTGGDGFDGLVFDFDDEGAGAAVSSAPSSPVLRPFGTTSSASDTPSMQPYEADPPRRLEDMLAGAMAASFGLVDKIDFDSLTFETDDD